MRIFQISKAIIYKEFTVTIRYKIQLVSGFVFLLATLIGLVLGGNQLLGNAENDGTALSLLSGFLLFFLTNLCIRNPSGECSTATNEGNMETLSMFSIPLYTYLSLQTFFKTLANIGIFIGAGIVASLLLGINFMSIDMLVLIPFYFLSLLSGIGLGLILAGMQLLYKKVDYIISLTTIGISLALASSPQTNSFFIEIIPMKAFVTMFKDISVDKNSPQIMSMLAILVSSLFFYTLGVLVFNTMLKKAKIKGCLGGY